jgi:hypothetical protein
MTVRPKLIRSVGSIQAKFCLSAAKVFFGTYETMVMPSADKKALRYLSHNVGAGSFGDVVVKGSGKLLLESSPRRRLDCKNQNGKLHCQESTSENGRWTAARQRVLSPTSEAGAKALIAKLPAQYPDLPTGSFEPTLGVLSAMQGHWRGDTTNLFIEIGRDAKGPTVHLGMTDVPSRSLLFRAATPGGKLIADRAYPTEQNPAGRATVELAVLPSGKVQACGWQGKLKFCYDIWLSANPDLALLQYRNVVSPYPIDYTLGITRLMTTAEADTLTGLRASGQLGRTILHDAIRAAVRGPAFWRRLCVPRMVWRPRFAADLLLGIKRQQQDGMHEQRGKCQIQPQV